MELRDQDPIEPSSSWQAPAALTPTVVAEEQKLEVTEEDREVARVALVERMARKHPTRAAPRWFDPDEVALVASCASAHGGDRDAKTRGLRDAIGNAFAVSKDGPPTVRFIWGKLDHFLDHVERGRRRRLAEERNARMRADTHGAERALRPALAPSPRVPHEQMATDLERLFGPGWSANVPQ
jgi:hypothetical protein